jgi:hypothetical protein
MFWSDAGTASTSSSLPLAWAVATAWRTCGEARLVGWRLSLCKVFVNVRV